MSAREELLRAAVFKLDEAFTDFVIIAEDPDGDGDVILHNSTDDAKAVSLLSTGQRIVLSKLRKEQAEEP